MDLKEFKERYFRCLEKADLKTSWWLSDDCDEDAEVFIDESGDIYIKEIKTPYNYKDVVKVKKQPTNSDSLIGTDGIVTAEINNLEGAGKVYISGLTWSAKSKNGEKIPEGAVVTVYKIEGATLIIEVKNLAEASEE